MPDNDLRKVSSIRRAAPEGPLPACQGTGSCGTLCAMAQLRSLKRKNGGVQGVDPASRGGWTVPGSRQGMERAERLLAEHHLLVHGATSSVGQKISRRNQRSFSEDSSGFHGYQRVGISFGSSSAAIIEW